MNIDIPNYQVQEQIYNSNNTLVFRAIRQSDQQAVILKVLKKDYPTAAELARYHQEYAILCGLKDIAGIVHVYDLEKYQKTRVLCVEDLQGESLHNWLLKRDFTLQEQLILAIAISQNIAHIHQQQIIHKDINPANIIWNPATGMVKIIDFALSTQFSKQQLSLKNPEVLEGTLSYMSPEQTGRMNRALDYRSDFYSLGVTLYELFTGQLPFVSQDAMELVHSHLAKQPLPASEIKPTLPVIISNIISKLLAKTAEERYHSAWGIHADLQRCYDDLQQTGQIKPFELAQKDMSDRFYIPQKLYGRDHEIKQLLAAFERVAQGTTEIMLVAGYSGIGKSVLVKEIYRALTKSNGYFIGGKFDQLQRNVPYSALIAAFKELVQQLLTETETQLKQWQQKLLTALRTNGQVIIDVIPEVEQIIGKQPPIPELSPAEAQNRFNMVLQNFIRVFCHPDHPLVIFLDDLQWVDSATLKLLKLIAENKNNTALFLIGAYRDNEVSSIHPLMITLDSLREEQVIINQIILKPLAFEHVNQLIMDSLQQDKTKTLTDLVMAKTQGNPFFINQFLQALYKEHLLYFVPPTLEQKAYWQWDIQKIKNTNITDNVVDLMISKLKQLPESAQQMIRLAACIGNRFDLHTLAIVYEKSPHDTFQDVMSVLMEGLILPKSEAKLLDDDSSQLVIEQLQFLHDRVQQAAYALIDDTEKKAVHLQIGRLLLKNTGDVAEHIFDIVEQLNQSIELITEQAETLQMAQLNLMAGQKAKQANAYKAAINYLTIGRACLTHDSWQQHYDLTCQLFAEGVETAYLNGDYQQMEALAQTLSNHARSLTDEVKICEIRIEAYNGQHQPLKAIQIALDFLKRLNIHLPETPTSEEVNLALQAMSATLANKSIQKLVDLPNMTATNEKLAMRILTALRQPTYHSSPNLMIMSTLKQVELSLQYGNTIGSSFGYIGYSFMLCTQQGGDIKLGYQLSLLSLKLSEKLDPAWLQVRIFEIFNVLVRPWNELVSNSFQPLIENYYKGLETGELEFAAYSICMKCQYAYFTGQALHQFIENIALYTDEVANIKREHMVAWNRIFWQAGLNLVGDSNAPYRLIGEAYDETVQLSQHKAANDKTAVHFFYLHSSFLNYLFQRKAQAIEDSKMAEAYLDGAVGLLSTAIFYFYDSLIQLSVYTELSQSEQATCIDKVESNQQKMAHWAHHAPMNFQHKYTLVAAEKARVLGQHGNAREYYDQAIEQAEKNQYLNDAALAYELAGRFYIEKNKPHLAQLYLKDAHYAYQQWGAVAKAKDLETGYADLLINKQPVPALGTMLSSLTTTSSNQAASLDLNSIMKAAQTLSSEIVLDRLLEKMMQVVMENAGAEQGYLLLPKQDNWFIEAQINQQTTTILQSLPVEEYLALNVLNYVIRTQKPVVLDNAAQSEQFSHDAHIISQQALSLLCMPLLNRGNLVGILYLENNLTEGAFIQQRLEILNLLSSQLAISIQNALFYAELEEKVTERTQELKQQTLALEQANSSLLQLNQEKNEFLGIAAHDLKNPLQAVQGFAQLIAETLTDEEYEVEEIIEFANDIDISADRMFGLITNLLDVNAIEAGQMQVKLEQVDILPILQNVVDEYMKKAVAKNITVYFTPEHASYVAYVDPNTVHQILDNLISNAVKYSPLDKNVFIRAALQSDRVRIEIEDEGQGLSQADQAKLFGKFTRLSTKPTAGEHSTGLGLFIVAKLVDAMNGKVWCESELGHGATFILTLPVILGSNIS